MRRTDINDLFVSLARSHADTPRETAHQMGVTFLRSWFNVLGVLEAKGNRMAVPWNPEFCSTRPLERLFMDLLRQQPTSTGGAQYLMMFAVRRRLLATGPGWPYFLKRTSDVSKVFAVVLTDINAKGVQSIMECLRSGQRQRLHQARVRGDAQPARHPPRVHAIPVIRRMMARSNDESP